MTYFEHEVPKELVTGEEYTYKEIHLFIINNPGCTVLCSHCENFADESGRRVTVQAIGKYSILQIAHPNDLYNVSNKPRKVYFVE